MRSAEEILLTQDGQGVQAKREALDNLIRETEARVRAECAKAVCEMCEASIGLTRSRSGRWLHGDPQTPGRAFCRASAIHALSDAARAKGKESK